jgi:tRNA threonylcarbamoyladenosine biosynthesis protein TsaB
MPSLRQLLAAHAPLLVIDAASARIQVGAFAADGTARWAASDEEAGVGIFHAIESLGVNPDSVRAFVFCEGPGSVLGVRTAAMALRTWCALARRPVFAYTSLALVAATLGRPQTSVIADARRDAWHHFVAGGALRRVATADLAGELVMPEHFRNWSQLSAGVQRVPYTLAEMLPRAIDAELFHATDAPDAFLHEEPNYATWTPQIHRAPANS